MAAAIIIVEILPESPNTDLSKIKEYAKKDLEKSGASNISFEEKPIAFGLKSLNIKMDMPEEKGSEFVEAILAKIKGVSSVKILDYRRAFG